MKYFLDESNVKVCLYVNKAFYYCGVSCVFFYYTCNKKTPTRRVRGEFYISR